MLSCLQLGAVQNTAPSIECSLQSAVRILHSTFSTLHKGGPCGERTRICGILPLPSSWCRAPAPNNSIC